MKKRDLLFAGLLFAVPAFAQEGPTFTSQDAKVIFTQDFESDWDEWSSEVVDKIDGIYYYDVTNDQQSGNKNNIKIWEDSIWAKKIFRADTLIELKNGVVVTDSKSEIAANNFPGETYTIATDESSERHDAFKNFGEADEGGAKVFKYTSDTCTLASQSWGTYKGGYTANYRRNLFVRNIPIEPESSYRLTFYLKTKALPGHDVTPRMSAGVFRGYFASEKPFSNGLEDDANHYKYKTAIEYEKTDFAPSDQWEKVTYMTYYLNDSIANNFVFVDGYWWAEEWRWNQVVGEDTIRRDYHVQPDKFFVRLGFVSDYTEFQLDNLSLTKSWIGGAEYYGDKLRVDFGYKTNLAELAKAAKAKTNIAAAEVKVDVPDSLKAELGYDYRFEVWGQKDDDSWEEVYIRSAEFHDDGYMYMFTEFYDDDHAYQFDEYKQVLVTFHNPIDNPDLTLKYTGDGRSVAGLFPKALDTTWIKNGKIVPDFYNEIATPNPYVFNGVHSLKDLPPVLQVAPYEEGSIGLEPQQSFTFKFSREVLIDNDGEASLKAIGYVNDKVWTPSFNAETNELTITCPDDSWKEMNGDVEIKLIQLFGKGTNAGENVYAHYNFGAISRELGEAVEWYTSNFKGTDNGDGTFSNALESVPVGGAIMDGTKDYQIGTGVKQSSQSRMWFFDAAGQFERAIYFCPRGNTNRGGGHFYYGIGEANKINFSAGNHIISFLATGWDGKEATNIYVYPYTDSPKGVSKDNKILVGTFTPTTQISSGDAQKKTEPYATIDFAEEFSFGFSVPASGAYIIEFAIENRSWSGTLLSDFTLAKAPLSYVPVAKLNDAVAAAQERVELANVDTDLYGGTFLAALEGKINYYKVGGEFDALHETEPSVWDAAAKDMSDATNTMKLRMDTVDKFVETRDKVVAKLAEVEDYSGLAVYSALSDLNEEAQEYPVTTKTGPEIYDFNKQMDDAISALDARVAVNNAFAEALKSAKGLIDEAKKPQYDEYSALEACYSTYENLDVITPTESTEITDATAALKDAANAYNSRLLGASILPTRVKALYDLAKDLGSDIVNNGVLTERLEATDFDDDELANIYKTAIKIALYDLADLNDPKADSVDVTPFIKNYHLYTTPKIVERTDKQVPGGNGDADPDGANMQHSQHAYNSGDLNGKMPIWVMITGRDYTDLYPGWAVQSFATGNSMVTADKSYNSYKNGLGIFDGEIGMDWNSRAEMKQDLTDLPVGVFTLGVELTEFTPNAGDGKIARLTVKTLDKSYVGEATEKGAQKLAVDSIMVAENDSVNIHFMLRSQNGWSRADNFFLTFHPDEDYDYEEAIDALEDELNELMTVVDARQAVKEGVEYFTVGGIKLDAPKAGQILIRKTTQSNGKVVMDKVLIK
jgi:hypothetical protein